MEYELSRTPVRGLRHSGVEIENLNDPNLHLRSNKQNTGSWTLSFLLRPLKLRITRLAPDSLPGSVYP